MADYAPPSGPPPPHVPPGWKAVWNEQYKEWFFVNTYTKASTWEKPTAPAQPAGEGPPGGPPPSYGQGPSMAAPNEKQGHAYGGSVESDEALARRLQAEENQRLQGHSPGPGSRGQADSYYSGSSQPQYNQSQYTATGSAGQPYGQSPQPPQEQGKKGLFSKLTGGLGGSKPHQQYAPQQGYGQYPPQQHYPPQGYGQYPPQGYAQPAYAAAPARHGGGMGALGGAGLGLGAGLLGGALIGEAMDGGDGGDGGGYGGDDGGGDYGGDGGGDFGGGDGGGDF